MPPLEKPPENIKDINFSNGYYQFKINEGSDNIYFEPFNMDIVLEYMVGIEIRFIVHNGCCIKYYVNGTSRDQDVWIDDLYSMFVYLVQEADPRIKLDGLKFMDYELSENIDIEYLNKFKKYKQVISQKGGTYKPYIDKNLSLFFYKTIENYYVANLPIYKVKQNKILKKYGSETFEQIVIASTFDLISFDKIYFNELAEKILSNKVCDGNLNINMSVFPNIDFNQTIKKVYLTDVIDEKSTRNIVICNKDMFGLYDINNLVSIYNSSPDVIGDIKDYDKIFKNYGQVKIPLSITGGNIKSEKKIIFDQVTINKLKKIDKTYSESQEDLSKIYKYSQKLLKETDFCFKYSFNGKEFCSVKEILNFGIFNGTIDYLGNIKFVKPYYLDNPIFYDKRYFALKNEDGVIILEPAKSNLIYFGNKLVVKEGTIRLINYKNTNEKVYLSLIDPIQKQNINKESFLYKLLNVVNDKSNL